MGLRHGRLSLMRAYGMMIIAAVIATSLAPLCIPHVPEDFRSNLHLALQFSVGAIGGLRGVLSHGCAFFCVGFFYFFGFSPGDSDSQS